MSGEEKPSARERDFLYFRPFFFYSVSVGLTSAVSRESKQWHRKSEPFGADCVHLNHRNETKIC